MHRLNIFLMLALLASLSGCAEIHPFETPSEVLKHPLGTDPIRLGMTKEEVKGLWGQPDKANKLGFGGRKSYRL